MEEVDVIGLLGPAGSGKDLVADWFIEAHGFYKVAFADPIKRFAMKAFGLDKEKLWGPSEARNHVFEVEDSWWFETIGHFPDAANEILNEVLEPGYRTEGFLKLHDWLTELRKNYRSAISARVILQTLGTEWGRAVDDLMWVKYAHKVANTLKTVPGMLYSQEEGLFGPKLSQLKHSVKGIIIPDHRFKNEVTETQKLGGYVIRLRRLEHEKKDETVGIAGHRSESELKTIPDEAFNLVMEFPEGIEKVYNLLNLAYEEKLWRAKNPLKLQGLTEVNRS